MALDIAKLEEEIKEEQQQTEDKPPKAMEELYNLLQQLGSAWREDNAYIVNEGQKNERTVIPLPNVSTVANVLENHCHFTFIGDGAISDVSKTNMTNTNKTTAPMTLAELKAWVEETCELSELLQTKDYKSYLPEEKQEEFEAIAFSVFNCLESFLMMLEDGELYYQPKPIEEESDLDNQADEMAQYQELAKEVEDSEKEAREIAYLERSTRQYD